jgi:hypothetical protein
MGKRKFLSHMLFALSQEMRSISFEIATLLAELAMTILGAGSKYSSLLFVV